jgi:hypothetical protein
MKHSAMLVSLLASSFFIVTAVHAQNALTDEQARKLAADTVARATGTPANQLNTRRREDVEDALFSFQRKVAGRIHRVANFYDVLNGGYQITADQATYSTPTQRWLVAVSTDAGATFGLEGFSDAETAFDRLISKSDVEIHNAAQAENFSRFYLGAVYGNSDNIVYDELRLRHKVEEHFVGYADLQEPLAQKERRYRVWWAGLKARNPAQLSPSTKSDGDNRYRVSVNILRMTVGRPPELLQWSVQVQSDGSCRVLSKKTIYPPDTHKLRNSNLRQ